MRYLVIIIAAFAALALAQGCDDDPSADGDADTDIDADGDSDGDSDADGGGCEELECTFNRDCPETHRCECDEETGCFCCVGERGTGRNGIDPCDDGNDCASSLCVEGNGGIYYCSDECEDNDGCGPNLPACTYIAFVGQICVRDPEG
jgi:hypothetical protein